MKELIKLLILSRIAIYLIALLSSLLIEHGEQSVGLYTKIFKTKHPNLFKFLRPLVFYDGDFFFEISLIGYNYDKINAFFPGFPYLVSIFERPLELFLPGIEKPILIIFAAWILNFVLSVLTLIIFDQLFKLIPSKDYRLRNLTLKILIFNPLSIYLSTFYSEALFLFLQSFGLLLIAKPISKGSLSLANAFLSAFVFSLGGFVRSNGFLSGGFVIYFFVLYNLKAKIRSILKCVFVISFIIFLSVLPFFIVQYNGYKIFCQNEIVKYSFCQRKLPSVYNFVQKKYWDVEFLSFIEGRRFVNLVYILPVFAVIFAYAANKFKLKEFKGRIFWIFYLRKIDCFEDFFIPNFYLFAILIVFGLTVMHYNSFTRLLGGYPLFYIFIAELYLNGGEKLRKLLRFWIGAFQVFIVVFAVNNYLPI